MTKIDFLKFTFWDWRLGFVGWLLTVDHCSYILAFVNGEEKSFITFVDFVLNIINLFVFVPDVGSK